jgi:hypothetical protein
MVNLYKTYGKFSDSKGFLNTNTAITRQLIRKARKIAAERKQVLRRSVNTGTKEDSSCTGRVWAAGFHHVKTHSRLADVLKLMKHLFI